MCLFFLFSIIFAGTDIALACEEQGNHIALITGIVNGVSIERKGEQCEGKIRMRLYEGDILTTASAQKCLVMFGDGSEIKLNENTKLLLQQLAASKARKKKTILNLFFGEIFANVSKDKGRQFEVKAGRAVAAIEGTIFNYRWLHGDPYASLTVADGSVRYFGLGSPRYYGIKPPKPYWIMVRKNYRCDYEQQKPPNWIPSIVLQVPDMKAVIGWNESIRKYVETIREAVMLCKSLVESAGNGTMDQESTRRLNDLIYEFDQIKHDSDFDQGHKALYTAFINFRRCAAGYPEFCATAQGYYTQGTGEGKHFARENRTQNYYKKGIAEFQIYEQKFETSEEQLRRQY